MNVAHVFELYNREYNPENDGKKKYDPRPAVPVVIEYPTERAIEVLKEHKDLCMVDFIRLTQLTKHIANKTLDALKENNTASKTHKRVNGRKTFVINLKKDYQDEAS